MAGIEEFTRTSQSVFEHHRQQYRPYYPSVLYDVFSNPTGVYRLPQGGFKLMDRKKGGKIGELIVMLQPPKATEHLQSCHGNDIGILFDCPRVPGLWNVVAGLWDFFDHQPPGANRPRILLFESFAQLERLAYRELTEDLVRRCGNLGDYVGAGEAVEQTTRVRCADSALLHAARNLGLCSMIIVANGSSSSAENRNLKVEGLKIFCVPLDVTTSLHVPIGLDTTSRIVSELVGTMMAEVTTSQDTYQTFAYFGRFDVLSISFECVLSCRPNLCLMSTNAVPPPIDGKALTCRQVFYHRLAIHTAEITDLIFERGQYHKKNFGVICMGDVLEDLGTLYERGEGCYYSESSGGGVVPVESSVEVATVRQLYRMPSSYTPVSPSVMLKSYASIKAAPDRSSSSLECGELSKLMRYLWDRSKVSEKSGTTMSRLEARKKRKTRFRLIKFMGHLVMEQVHESLKNRNYPLSIPAMNFHLMSDDGGCAAAPTDFDCTYASAFGYLSGILLSQNEEVWNKLTEDEKDKENSNLASPLVGSIIPVSGMESKDWVCGGLGWSDLAEVWQNKSSGKTLTRFDRFIRAHYVLLRHWRVKDLYRNPGPVQYYGPTSAECPMTISDEPYCLNYLMPQGPPFKSNFPLIAEQLSRTQRDRVAKRHRLTPILRNPKLGCVQKPNNVHHHGPDHSGKCRQWLPDLTKQTGLNTFKIMEDHNARPPHHLVIGVILFGQPCAGTGNVLFGMYERAVLHSSKVIGFKSLEALKKQDYVVLDRNCLNVYVNLAGFEYLGHTNRVNKSRIGSDSAELQEIAHACAELYLDGLAIIGGASSATEAAHLSEYLIKVGVQTKIVLVPASPSNNVPFVETSLGFDSRASMLACRVGFMSRVLHRGEWLLVQVGGKYPTVAALEAGMRVHADHVILHTLYRDYGHDPTIAQRGSVTGCETCDLAELGQLHLEAVIQDIITLIKSAKKGKDQGIIFVPNDILANLTPAKSLCDVRFRSDHLNDPRVADTIALWPEPCRKIIEYHSDKLPFPTVEILSSWIEYELSKDDTCAFTDEVLLKTVCFETAGGRSGMPTNFDSALGTAYGYLATALISIGITGVVASLANLAQRPESWVPLAVPLTTLFSEPDEMDLVDFGSKAGPRICPRQPDETLSSVKAFCRCVAKFRVNQSAYPAPGPTQFHGPAACPRPLSLLADRAEIQKDYRTIGRICRTIMSESLDLCERMDKAVVCAVLSKLQEVAGVLLHEATEFDNDEDIDEAAAIGGGREAVSYLPNEDRHRAATPPATEMPATLHDTF